MKNSPARWMFSAEIAGAKIPIYTFDARTAKTIPWLHRGWLAEWKASKQKRDLRNPEITDENGNIVEPMFE